MTLCLAPFTHTYCSPQGERRMCCASREPSQNFKQYIDTDNNNSEIKFSSLEEHWNSDHMKSVRKRMLSGEELPECDVCNNKLLNTDVYRDYFNKHFGYLKEQIISETSEDGTYNKLPISFDYRFSNICNFKCRMCGPMLSSAWESEYRNHSDKLEAWMGTNVRNELIRLQDNMFNDMITSIKNKTLREIYWVGGEPLLFLQHWYIMHELHGSGMAKHVYVRYNTNLCNLGRNKNENLFCYLKNHNDWQICASLDGTGIIGEYIRTGLDYNKFIQNFEEGVNSQTKPGQMRLDFTLTTPGLFEIENMFMLSKKYNVPLLTKVCFEFSPDIALCPLFLPKNILHPILNDLITKLEPQADLNQKPLIDVLKNLLTRQTMEEKYPNYKEGRIHGKKRIQYLESIRLQPITMIEILSKNSELALDFWNGIQENI